MLSGKFVLRLDQRLHQRLKEEAKSQGSSLNTLCLKKLSQSASSPHAEVLSSIVDTYQPLGVVLFGSAARGESRESSDIDLLIILDASTPINRDLYQKWEKALPKATKYSPQFVHISPQNDSIGGIWLESSLEGEILYDRDKIVKNEMIRIRSVIADGKYLRKASHGHAYWVKQELVKNAK